MGSTKNTKWEEYTPTSIAPITTDGIYKSNKPCDYTSFDGELCPWHGLPGKKYEPQFKIAPKLPQTWEDVQTLIIESDSNKEDDTTILPNNDKIDFDNCSISEVVTFLQRMAKDPHTSTLNLAFTEHITNALIKAREEKLRVEASIPRKLEDGWDPMIKIKLNNFSCYALCDVGASTSVMPKRIYDMLKLKPFDSCSFGVRLVDSSIKKPLGRIDDILIVVNDNYVPVDFTIMDIECDPSCPIILGRPFLRTVGAIIDMKEGNIKFQFPLKKGMEHFPRKKIKLPFESVVRASYSFTLDKT